MTDDELKQLSTHIHDQQIQITALTSVVRSLIETHPDRAAVGSVLARTIFRIEALAVASPLPDSTIEKHLSLLAEWRKFAQKAPGDGGDAASPQPSRR